MQMRAIVRHVQLNQWRVKLAFQPDWQEYEGEYRHIEFGSRVFELRSPAPLAMGDTCLLDQYCETVIERFFTETVWITDPNTGEPIRRERTLLAPVSDVDEQELQTLTERLLNCEGPILLDDGSQLRVRDLIRYWVVRTYEKPEWELVRVREGEYTPFYTNEPIPVIREWPERHFKLTVLEAGTSKDKWRVTYALWPNE